MEKEIKDLDLLISNNEEENALIDQQEEFNTKNPRMWIDRELSWLEFNKRVLRQIDRDDMPVQDRLRFIGIADSNLSEFISVRFTERFKTETDRSFINTLRAKIKEQKKEIEEAYLGMNKDYGLISKVENKEDFHKFYNHSIYTVITPILVGTNKEIPVLDEKDVNFFCKIHPKDKPDEHYYCFIQIPHQVNRFITMKHKTYLIEDIIRCYMDDIFNTCVVDDYVQFVVYKDFTEEINHNNTIKITARINEVLMHRLENNITWMDILVYNPDKSNIVNKLTKLLKVPKHNIFFSNDKEDTMIGLHTMSSFKFNRDETEEYRNKINMDFNPRLPDKLADEHSILNFLEDEDLLVQHPYETYDDTVVRFLQEAANDPKVISIKQTLYRVSSKKSPIINALCDASKNGVKVTVMLELLARFDERQNLSLIAKLKDSGVNIVYSLDGLKTHCKMCLVVKATKKGITIFSHVGTGNYNEKTARIYTDISYFTSRKNVGAELNQVFNMITGISRPSDLKRISYSPITLRPCIMEGMKWVCEAVNPDSNQEFPKNIYIKVNSLSDIEMVKYIEELAEQHPDTTFNIICRGICSLPMRENVKIKSIVGRFLEHSRIYMFNAGKEWKVYISSADLLTRNLDKRIETLIAIEDSASKKKVKNIFSQLWKDTANTWWLNKDNEWEKDESGEYINTQNVFTLK